jgi:hypothetical protein
VAGRVGRRGDEMGEAGADFVDKIVVIYVELKGGTADSIV